MLVNPRAANKKIKTKNLTSMAVMRTLKKKQKKPKIPKIQKKPKDPKQRKPLKKVRVKTKTVRKRRMGSRSRMPNRRAPKKHHLWRDFLIKMK